LIVFVIAYEATLDGVKSRHDITDLNK